MTHQQGYYLMERKASGIFFKLYRYLFKVKVNQKREIEVSKLLGDIAKSGSGLKKDDF